MIGTSHNLIYTNQRKNRAFCDEKMITLCAALVVPCAISIFGDHNNFIDESFPKRISGNTSRKTHVTRNLYIILFLLSIWFRFPYGIQGDTYVLIVIRSSIWSICFLQTGHVHSLKWLKNYNFAAKKIKIYSILVYTNKTPTGYKWYGFILRKVF